MESPQNGNRRDSARLDRVVLIESSWDAMSDALMRSEMIEVHISSDEALQLLAVKNEYVIQAFLFQAADKSLAVGIGRGSSKRSP